MIRSMTGFASKLVTLTLADDGGKVNLTINLKSLNSRFFEASCKLPHQISTLETELIKILKNKLHRGHIYLTMHIDNQNLFKGDVEPSIKVIDGYLKAIDKIKERFSLGGAITIDDLVQLPNVFSIEEQEIDDASKKLILDTVSSIADDLMTMQTHEGARLEKDMEQRLAIMEKEILLIEKASAVHMAAQKEKVQATLRELETDVSKLAELQKNAAYVMLDKIDIHEEIVRFKSHLKELNNQLKSAELEKGKRIDFILQELAREINTIAAKCSDATIGSHAINVKVEIEKTREQVQNIV